MILRLDPTQLDGSPPSATTWGILNTTIGVPCVSGSLLGKPRIRPGDSAHSAIFQLIDQRGALQMPPIASLVVDSPDVAVVESWIDSLVADGGVSAIHDGGVLPDAGHFPHDAGPFEAGTEAGADSGSDGSAGDLDSATQDATISPDDAAIEAGD